MLVFYVFFEGVLIPMFLIIGVWGGPAPRLCGVQVLPLHAARLGADAGRDYRDVSAGGLPIRRATAGFDFAPRAADLAVAGVLCLILRSKCRCGRSIPGCRTRTLKRRRRVGYLWPACCLKMGGYGFLRFSLPMFPEASDYFAPLVYRLSIVAVDLHLAGGACPGGHEEADRVFVGRPYGRS